MTAVTAPAPLSSSTGREIHLNAGRVLRSEWIKFITVRSTVWTIAVTLVVMVGFSLLMAVGVTSFAEADGPGEGAPAGDDGIVSGVMVATFGYAFGQIVVAVLGVLVISGEYTTGQIRSTLAAVPTRLPVLWAKAIILGVTAFVVGAVAVVLSALVTTPMLAPYEMAVDFSDSASLQMMLGVPLYLTAIALLGLGIGTLLRHSAGGIATVLGILLVLPILSIVPLTAVQNAAPYLPSVAGERIITGADVAAVLTPWQGYGVLWIYVVVVMAAAAVLLRRRDA